MRWRVRVTGEYQMEAGFCSSPAIGLDGTVYLGTPDGYVYAVAPDGNLRWRYRTGVSKQDSRHAGMDPAVGVNSTPAVGSDGTVYVGSDDRYLYAIWPDGRLRWRLKTGGPVRSSPSVGPDGSVFVGSGDCNLYAVRPDGRLKWRFRAAGPVDASPALAPDGTLLVGSGHIGFGQAIEPTGEYFLYALAMDGKLKWRMAVGGPVGSSPALAADGTVYFGSTYGFFGSYHTGDPVPAFWEVRDPRAGTPWKGTPGSSGLLLFFVDDHLYAVSASGHLKWRFRTPGAAVTSTPAIDADGTIYVGSHDGFVYAVGPDGEMKWRFPTGGSVASSPAIDASGTVIVGSDDGSLYAIGKDGTQRWRLRNGRVERSSPTRLSPQFAEPRFVWRRSETPVMRTSPAIAPDGTVYVASSDGCLYAVR